MGHYLVQGIYTSQWSFKYKKIEFELASNIYIHIILEDNLRVIGLGCKEID